MANRIHNYCHKVSLIKRFFNVLKTGFRWIKLLPTRYRLAKFYMAKCGYTFKTAWCRAGMVLL